MLEKELTVEEVRGRYSSFLPKLWLAKLKYPARTLLQPRHFHAFCIGTLKSGTHSIASIFDSRYRVSHEMLTDYINLFIIDENAGLDIKKKVTNFYKLRDNYLWLELESSYFNYYFIDVLNKEFKDLKYIITIRDPYSWLDSWINHTINRPESKGSIWEKALYSIFSPDKYEYGEEEELFRNRGLFPLTSYLNYWANHNKKVLDNTSNMNRIIIKTDQISSSTEKIANFLEIPEQHIKMNNSHQFKAVKKHEILRSLNSDYLDSLINSICGELVRDYFPDIYNHREKVLGIQN